MYKGCETEGAPYAYDGQKSTLVDQNVLYHMPSQTMTKIVLETIRRTP